MYFLGIDGGGTKTAFCLVNELGDHIASHNDSATNYLVNGLEHTQAVFKRGIETICQQAHISVSEIEACFCAVAGYGDIESDKPRVNQALQSVFPELNLQIGNDTENGHAGSLAGETGINIIAGTGSISYGLDEQGNSLRVGGWHHLFGGDEGSGYWCATKLLLHFTRQSDGREPRTYLYDYLKEKYHWTDDSQMLATLLDEWKEDRTKIANMSKDVTACALQQDPVCLTIFEMAAQELSEIILATKQQLHFNEPVKCSYSGGMFKAGDLILTPLKEKLSPHQIQLVEPQLSPLAGACVLAMKIKKINIPVKKLNEIN